MSGNEASKLFYAIVGENIKKYRDTRGYTLEALGRKIGVEKKTIQRYEQGEIKIDMNRLAALAEALGVKIAKLLKGTESFLGVETGDENTLEIPILGFVPAGGPVMTEGNIDGHISLPKMLLKSEKDFCLKIRGDSMEDVGINDGDLILVHPQPVAENGQTIIARINDEVTCKRFYRTNGKCRLEPANQKYKPIDCNEIEVIGIVIRVIKEIF